MYVKVKVNQVLVIFGCYTESGGRNAELLGRLLSFLEMAPSAAE